VVPQNSNANERRDWQELPGRFDTCRLVHFVANPG
jgi:hypothetical protein